MDWRWIWFWTIVWNAFIHAVTLNWIALQQDGEDLKTWWRSLWDEITNRLDRLRDWAEGRVNWLKGYAFGLFYQLGMDAARWVANLRVELTPIINSVRTWAEGRINWLRQYAERLKNEAVQWARNSIDAAKATLYPYIDSVARGILDLFAWVDSYKWVITEWLQVSQASINWLRDWALGRLQSFLHDPIGYVLGWLLDPIVNLINWWAAWGHFLRDFVTQDLPALRNLLARGLGFLLTFVDRPGETILNLLYPIFLDWIEQVIVDNW